MCNKLYSYEKKQDMFSHVIFLQYDFSSNKQIKADGDCKQTNRLRIN